MPPEAKNASGGNFMERISEIKRRISPRKLCARATETVSPATTGAAVFIRFSYFSRSSMSVARRDTSSPDTSSGFSSAMACL